MSEKEEKNDKVKVRKYLDKLDLDNPYIIEIETPQGIIELKIKFKKKD